MSMPRMNDGSLLVASFWERGTWGDLRKHLEQLPGLRITNYLTDQITEVWIDFVYEGISFTVNNQFGEYWLFQNDEAISHRSLDELIQHFESRLGKRLSENENTQSE